MKKLIIMFILMCAQINMAIASDSTQETEAMTNRVNNIGYLQDLQLKHAQDNLFHTLKPNCKNQEIEQALSRISPIDSPAFQNDINWMVTLYESGHTPEQRNFYGQVLKCFAQINFPNHVD